MNTRTKTKLRRAAFVIAFLLPAFAFLAVFLYYPIEETFRLSVMKSSGLGQDVFVGLRNYARLLHDDDFKAGLWHVLTWAFWSIVIQIPLAFTIAFSLTFYKNKLTGPLRAIYYLANVLPSAITAMIGMLVFSPGYGIITRLAEAFGMTWVTDIDFFGNPNIAFWTVFAMATWAYTGFPIIYLMARMEQIPNEIRDAAELEGVTGWKYARFIVLPMVSYPIRILAVLCTVGSLKLFDLPYLLTKGGPGNATTTLGIILYQQGFINWQYGIAAAIGVVIFVLSLGFTVLQFTASAGKDSYEG
jgi:raffinose/stachyose/melibiose transport system permease protein